MVTFLEDVFGRATAYNQPSTNSAVDQANALWQSPLGQAAQKAQKETAQFNVKTELDKAKRDRDRIAIEKGVAAANKWYNEQQVRIADQAHALAVQEAEATATGYWNGAPTLTRQMQEASTTGYYNNAPTLAREQQAASTALQAATLGSTLKGPRNWATYLNTAYGVANSPASSFVQTVPGGLGQNNVNAQKLTLRDVLNDYGVGTGTAPGGTTAAAAPYSPNGVTAADLGLGGEDEAKLRDYFASPTHAPPGFWESKSEDQRQYLRGLAENWGYSPDSFESIYRNTRARQGSAMAA